LVSIVASLPLESRNLFNRIFDVDGYLACLSSPQEMHPWIIQQFGSLEAVQVQKTVKVTNCITGEGTLFNELRASRPRDESERLKMQALLVDRGDPRSRASDIAAMELYDASVVASDPLRLARMTKGRCFPSES
jgi:hypothetical protein